MLNPRTSDLRYDYPLPPRAALPEQNDGMIIVGAVAVLFVLGVIAYTMGGERLQAVVSPEIETTGRSERAPTPPAIQPTPPAIQMPSIPRTTPPAVPEEPRP